MACPHSTKGTIPRCQTKEKFVTFYDSFIAPWQVLITAIPTLSLSSWESLLLLPSHLCLENPSRQITTLFFLWHSTGISLIFLWFKIVFSFFFFHEKWMHVAFWQHYSQFKSCLFHFWVSCSVVSALSFIFLVNSYVLGSIKSRLLLLHKDTGKAYLEIGLTYSILMSPGFEIQSQGFSKFNTWHVFLRNLQSTWGEKRGGIETIYKEVSLITHCSMHTSSCKLLSNSVFSLFQIIVSAQANDFPNPPHFLWQASPLYLR